MSATLARCSRLIDGGGFCVATSLVARRSLELVEVSLSSRWSRRRIADLGEKPIPAGPRITCVIPMYQEQDIAADTVRAWHEIVQQSSIEQVVLVTTTKEQPAAGRSTHDVLLEALTALHRGDDRILLLRCEDVTPFRASQLNLAVEHARRRQAVTHTSHDEIWIGVYNADSRPQPSTFSELAQRTRAEPRTRIFQQLVDYVVPQRPGTGHVAVGNAVLMTWWTRSHYWARNQRGSRGASWWSATAPYSTFGHGEFIRIDFLDEIGGFPDFAYADGLLLGWICRLRAEPIGLLASRDVAEVPRTATDLLTQQTAWMRGLLNFGVTTQWCRDHGHLRLTSREVALLRLAHGSIPVVWGLSSIAAGAAFAHSVGRITAGRASRADFLKLAVLTSHALLPALLPRADLQPRHPRVRRMLGASLAWPVEGLAFWPALIARLRRTGHPPTKTPR